MAKRKVTKQERIEHIFRFMEWDELTDAQHDLVIKFEERYNNRRKYQGEAYLTEPEYDVLEDIFKQAAEKA